MDAKYTHVEYENVNDRALEILRFLETHMPESNLLVCHNALLREEFGVSRSTITNAISLLQRQGLIEVVKMGRVNVYGKNGSIKSALETCGGYAMRMEGVKVLVPDRA